MVHNLWCIIFTALYVLTPREACGGGNNNNFILPKKRYQVKKILNNSANGVIYQGIIAMTSFLWRHLTLIPGYRKTDGQLVCVKQVPKSRVHQVRDPWTKTDPSGSRTRPEQDRKKIRNPGQANFEISAQIGRSMDPEIRWSLMEIVQYQKNSKCIFKLLHAIKLSR